MRSCFLSRIFITFLACRWLLHIRVARAQILLMEVGRCDIGEVIDMLAAMSEMAWSCPSVATANAVASNGTNGTSPRRLSSNTTATATTNVATSITTTTPTVTKPTTTTTLTTTIKYIPPTTTLAPLSHGSAVALTREEIAACVTGGLENLQVTDKFMQQWGCKTIAENSGNTLLSQALRKAALVCAWDKRFHMARNCPLSGRRSSPWSISAEVFLAALENKCGSAPELCANSWTSNTGCSLMSKCLWQATQPTQRAFRLLGEGMCTDDCGAVPETLAWSTEKSEIDCLEKCRMQEKCIAIELDRKEKSCKLLGAGARQDAREVTTITETPAGYYYRCYRRERAVQHTLEGRGALLNLSPFEEIGIGQCSGSVKVLESSADSPESAACSRKCCGNAACDAYAYGIDDSGQYSCILYSSGYVYGGGNPPRMRCVIRRHECICRDRPSCPSVPALPNGGDNSICAGTGHRTSCHGWCAYGHNPRGNFECLFGKFTNVPHCTPRGATLKPWDGFATMLHLNCAGCSFPKDWAWADEKNNDFVSHVIRVLLDQNSTSLLGLDVIVSHALVSSMGISLGLVLLQSNATDLVLTQKVKGLGAHAVKNAETTNKCLTASSAASNEDEFKNHSDFSCTVDSPWLTTWDHHVTTTTTTIITTTTTTTTSTTTTTTSTADMGPLVPIVSAILEIVFADAQKKYSKNIPEGLEAPAWSASLAALQSWIMQTMPYIAGEVQVRDLETANAPPRIRITFDVFVLVGDTANVSATIAALEGATESVLLERMQAQLLQVKAFPRELLVLDAMTLYVKGDVQIREERIGAARVNGVPTAAPVADEDPAMTSVTYAFLNAPSILVGVLLVAVHTL